MPKEKKALPKGVLWISLLAVVVAGGLVAASLWSSRPPAPPEEKGSHYYTEGATKGVLNAKVTIIEYSDYQCPVCGYFAKTYEPLLDEYIEAGKVRFIYKDFAFLGQESHWAAEAAKCAAEQDRFWEYHDKLFWSQRGENEGAFSKANLKKFARELGLNAQAFDECLDSGRYAEAVDQETKEGRARGVNGTPTFFINGRELRGMPRSFAELRNMIEEELSK